jgi:molybdenum cofactor cytidylyltransferase
VIAGIVLAAGRSSRMGASKALLAASDTDTFLSRLVATLRAGGVPDPMVVARDDDEGVRAEARRCGARVIVNPRADEGGQLSSILAGLAAVDHARVRALVVMPVDAPLVTPQTIAELLAAFDATLAPVVRPCHRGRHGHPVLFSRAVFDELRRADPSLGAKAVLRAHAAAILNLEVDDAGVLGDIDTPDSYRAAFGHDPSAQS